MWAYPLPADVGHHGHHDWQDPQYYDDPPELAQNDSLHPYGERGHDLAVSADNYPALDASPEDGDVANENHLPEDQQPVESGDASAPVYSQYSDPRWF